MVVVVIVIVFGIVGFFFSAQKLPTYKLSIAPAKLLPFVSHAEARLAVCDKMKEQLFAEICQKKFERVGKNDTEKISALFSLLKKIENDRNISDYDRLLLAQTVFASLPTKDSPLANSPGFSSTLVQIKNFIIRENIA